MTSRACGTLICCAASAVGTARTAPDFSRFMLLLMKACGLVRNSATSIWSSETPGRCVFDAMRDSESPGRTRYSSAPPPADGALGVLGALAALGGRDSDGTGAGDGAAAIRRSGRGAATGGGAIGAAAGASATAGA